MFFLPVLSKRVLYVHEHANAEDTAAVIPPTVAPWEFPVSFKKGQEACSQPCTVARDLPVLCGGRTLVKVFPSNTYACKNF